MGKILNIYMIIVIIISITIMIIDIKKLEIPNILNVALLMIGILYRGTVYGEMEQGLIGAGLYTLPAIIIYGYTSDMLDRDAIGMGDVKLLIGIGYINGYKGLYDIYLFYFAAFMIASVFVIIHRFLLNKKTHEIPFSPFLLIAFLYQMVII